jgi:hypothetical protein
MYPPPPQVIWIVGCHAPHSEGGAGTTIGAAFTSHCFSTVCLYIWWDILSYTSVLLLMGHGTEEESGNSESPSAFLAGQYATTFLMMVTLSNDTFAVFKPDF